MACDEGPENLEISSFVPQWVAMGHCHDRWLGLAERGGQLLSVSAPHPTLLTLLRVLGPRPILVERLEGPSPTLLLSPN